MQIKSVDKKGNALPFKPNELVTQAVQYAVKNKNTAEIVYWVLKDSVKVEACNFTITDAMKNTWTAEATGTAMIGFTVARTDRFHEAREHHFKIKYENDTDDLGLPDLFVSSFNFTPVENDPSKIAGAYPELLGAVEVKKPEKFIATTKKLNS